ncbi:MAG: hypothetical protein KBT53_09985, partial [Porticoccus sp.]|nr:hypothetical protein [Porticoccus sp.]
MTKKEIHKTDNNDCEWLFGLHTVQAILKTSASKVQEIRVQKGRDDQRLKKILYLAEQQEIPVTWVLRSDL